ncbi:M91 family zinc metallopeptidase [Sandaracinus amylolyticus]|uniref:Uncharacterized protein n=1 Tax=Sandaracinus amylolyticus TaxID=927083 RepID=A0A0F6YMT7_9BACT|nr:M91 family zinc metallopeptidase [Sandaracinus amylolyticus]AKF09645.1 hypothetical protein DB32_006794 [Sandaracinus amylolyticus]
MTMRRNLLRDPRGQLGTEQLLLAGTLAIFGATAVGTLGVATSETFVGDGGELDDSAIAGLDPGLGGVGDLGLVPPPIGAPDRDRRRDRDRDRDRDRGPARDYDRDDDPRPCSRGGDDPGEGPSSAPPMPRPTLGDIEGFDVGDPERLSDHNGNPLERVRVGNITITGSPEFVERARRDLETIASTPSGRRLLRSLRDSGGTVQVGSQQGGGGATDRLGPSTARLSYNPEDNALPEGVPGGRPGEFGHRDNYPSDVTLFHELVHADDIVRRQNQDRRVGRRDARMCGLRPGCRGVQQNELRTVGLGPYADAEFTENQYRGDRGLPRRDFYSDPNEQRHITPDERRRMEEDAARHRARRDELDRLERDERDRRSRGGDDRPCSRR